jgi:hypothetical protein
MHVRKLSGMFRKRAALVAFPGKRFTIRRRNSAAWGRIKRLIASRFMETTPARGWARAGGVSRSPAGRPAPPASSVTGWPSGGS